MVADASDFARRLPPKGRDFEAYRLTAVEGLSTREAAARMGLSQTRVVQLRDRVLTWLAAEMPCLESAPPEQRLAAAEYLAVERMEFLYGASVAAWRQSQGQETVERRSGLTGDARTIIRTSHGNVRYLQQAMRVAKEMGKFPLRSLPPVAEELDDDDCGEKPVSPPKGDCSASQAIRLRIDSGSGEPIAAKRVEESTYEDVFSAADSAEGLQRRENGPVQPGRNGEADAAQAGPLLNRQMRRARQRQLEKAMKRKAK